MARYRINKYGVRERDLHQEWLDNPALNPDFQEGFNFNQWSARQPQQRMAGDVAPQGLDQLIADIQSSKRDENFENLLENALQYTEQQAARPEVDIDALIAGTSQTAEQRIGKDLVLKGIMPDVLPADLYRAQDLLGTLPLGIAGPIQKDSVVKQSTTGGLNSDGVLEVQHKPLLTEYLSEDTEEQLYKAWRKLNPGEGRDKFNAAVGEYYGQQALKAVGNTPVRDEDRSRMVRKGQRNEYPKGQRPQYGLPLNPADSTEGTDRLIENSVGVLSKEIDRSGDYRYVDTDGNITVGDYQMGDLVGTGANKNDTVRLNVLKDLTGNDARTFKQKFSRGVELLQEKGISPTPLNVIKLMVEDRILPGPKRRKAEEGIRAGKALSAASMFREANYDDQYRYDTYLFGHGRPSMRDKPYGYMPEELIYVDNVKANSALGQRPRQPMTHGERYGRYNAGADIVASVQDLVDLGAAVRLHEDPRVAQLLR